MDRVTQQQEAPERAESIQQVVRMLRYDARAALTRAREEVDRPGVDPESVEYQQWLLVKGAAQASLGDTEDGARILREVKVWAEVHDEKALLASSHRRLSRLFRVIGAPARRREHAVAALELLDADTDPSVRADHLIGLADALGASGSYD